MLLESCKTELTRGMQRFALIVLTLSIGLSACGLPSKKPRAHLTEEGIFRALVSDPAFRDGNTDPRPVLEAVKRFMEELEELESRRGADTFIDVAGALKWQAAMLLEDLDSSSTCAIQKDAGVIARKICTFSNGPWKSIYLDYSPVDELKSKVRILDQQSQGQIVEFHLERLSFSPSERQRPLPEQEMPDILPNHRDRPRAPMYL